MAHISRVSHYTGDVPVLYEFVVHVSLCSRAPLISLKDHFPVLQWKHVSFGRFSCTPSAAALFFMWPPEHLHPTKRPAVGATVHWYGVKQRAPGGF